MKFEQLPISVQLSVKDTLKYFHTCYVTFENGDYHVSSAIGIYATYAPDHKYIGEYTDVDIFTPDELIINYVEGFHAYPIEYKGERDYRWINSLCWGDKVAFDANGNLVSA